ncbi:unnamed protein product, partial [Laminaria digitata]
GGTDGGGGGGGGVTKRELVRERARGRGAEGKRGGGGGEGGGGGRGGGTGDEKGADGGGEGKTSAGCDLFEPLPPLHVAMCSYAQATESLNILQDLEPDFVVLYDPDAAFVRALEAYQAERSRGRPRLMVYFMLYEKSVEEQRWD